MTPTAPSLSVVVSEAVLLAAKTEFMRGLGTGDAMEAALTAAFQHPEFIAQIRRQVVACVPGEVARSERDSDVDWGYFLGHGACLNEARASLGRLLGEEGK